MDTLPFQKVLYTFLLYQDVHKSFFKINIFKYTNAPFFSGKKAMNRQLQAEKWWKNRGQGTCSLQFKKIPLSPDCTHLLFPFLCTQNDITLVCMSGKSPFSSAGAPILSSFCKHYNGMSAQKKKRNKEGVETKKRALQISHLPAGTGKKGFRIHYEKRKGRGGGGLSCRAHQVEGFGAQNIPYNGRIEES